jgi:hypothetical protein
MDLLGLLFPELLTRVLFGECLAARVENCFESKGNLSGILREALSESLVWRGNVRIRFRPDEVYQWPCGPGAARVEDTQRLHQIAKLSQNTCSLKPLFQLPPGAIVPSGRFELAGARGRLSFGLVT